MKKYSRRSGSLFATPFGAVALVGVLSVAGGNLLMGPVTTASKVTHHNMARNDLLMNAKVVVMNAATRPNMGDEDGDGYVEPVPFLPVGENGCSVTLPAGGQGGCLPLDIGAIQTDPWATPYLYCVWDHGDPNSSTNRIDGEDNTSGAVLAVISAGPNKRFETPCLPYDGDPDTNDIAINPKGMGDDLVQIYTYAAAVAGSGGLWEIKQNEPTTAIIDKKLEIGDVNSGMGFAFDTETGQGEFPYVKTDYLASKSGGTTPVKMVSNIALDGQWLSGDGSAKGIFIAPNGNVGVGTNLPEAKLHVVGAVAISSPMGTHVQDTVLPRQGAYLGWNEINGLGRTHFLNHRGTGSGGWEFNAFDANGIYQETRLVIDQHGNVGIGTDSPVSKLTVAGGLEARSNNVGPAGTGVVHRLHTGPTPSSSLSWLELWGEHETARQGEAVLSGQNIVLRTGGDGAGVASLERVRIAHNGSMGIGTDSPNSTAKLDIASTTQGFLPPRMTTVQRDAINNPATGLMIFNVTDKVPEFFDGAEWFSMLGRGGHEVACAAPWGVVVKHGETITAYETASVSFGSACSREERACISGDLVGTFEFEHCVVGDPLSCALPWGGNLDHGENVVAYQYPDQSCSINQGRVCSNGTLSGTFENKHCILPLVGQVEFISAGNFYWTVPEGITSISVVAVGGGNGAGSSVSSSGTSHFNNSLYAFGSNGRIGGGFSGADGGGRGGDGGARVGSYGPGGGGAGGYSGNDGNGGNSSSDSEAGTSPRGAAGGGVGIYGQGENGAGGKGAGGNGQSGIGGAGGGGARRNYAHITSIGGGGGSGGQKGMDGTENYAVPGGGFGGGTSGFSSTVDPSGGGGLGYKNNIPVFAGESIPLKVGVGGAVRIIWPGNQRHFPDTRTQNEW